MAKRIRRQGVGTGQATGASGILALGGSSQALWDEWDPYQAPLAQGRMGHTSRDEGTYLCVPRRLTKVRSLSRSTVRIL